MEVVVKKSLSYEILVKRYNFQYIIIFFTITDLYRPFSYKNEFANKQYIKMDLEI